MKIASSIPLNNVYICIMLVAILVACSNNNMPDAEMVKNILSNTNYSAGMGNASNLKSRIDEGMVKLKNVRKTNGQAKEFFGVKFYEITYEVDIEYLKGFRGQNKEVKAGGYAGGGSGSCSISPPAQAGEVLTTTCTLKFELTEKGWKAPNGKIY